MPTTSGPILRRGARGDAVRALQQQIAAGMPGLLPSDFVDGDYGPMTEDVVRAIQERAAAKDPSIRVDGVVGDQTRPLIEAMSGSIPTPRTRADAISSQGPFPARPEVPGSLPAAPRIGNMSAAMGPRANLVQPGPIGFGGMERPKTFQDLVTAMNSRFGSDNVSLVAPTANLNAPASRPAAPAASTAATPPLAPATSGTSGTPRINQPIGAIRHVATQMDLPRDMNTAAFSRGNAFQRALDATFGQESGLSDIGIQDAPVVSGRSAGAVSRPFTPQQTSSRPLSLDAMPGSGSSLMEAASKPVTPATLSTPRLGGAAITPAATSSTPSTTPATTQQTGAGFGGGSGAYAGGGPTGSPAAGGAFGGSGGTGPGYTSQPASTPASGGSSGGGPGSGTSSGTAGTGSSGGSTPPSYYDSSRGGWQSWSTTTNSYQSSGV